MWFDFFCMAIFVAGIIYLPSVLIIRAFNQSWLKSFICAPLISVAAYCILSIVYAKVGLSASFFSLVVPLLIVEVLIFAIVGLVRTKSSSKQFLWSTQTTKTDWLTWGCYIGVAAIVAIYYYLGTLDGPASFSQDSDNTWHLALIQSFAQSGNFSVIDASLYHDYQQLDMSPLMPSGGTFYPAAWHILAAFCVQQFGVSVSLAANAVNMVFLTLVLPSNFWFLFKTLFPGNKKLLVVGSIFPLAFVAYPWGMFIFGPLYPNFAGLAFVPLVCALFIGLFADRKESNKILRIVLILAGICSMAMLHANAVFTFGVILVPYCVYLIVNKIYASHLDKKRKLVFSIIGSGLFCLVVLAIWAILYQLPFLQSTVGFSWDPYADKHQEFVNILLLAYIFPASQIILAGVVLLGVIYTFYNRRFLWITASYAIACGLCFLSATSDGLLKSFFTGFWYTDVHRLSATAVLAAIPLAALGLYVVLRFIEKIAKQLVGPEQQKRFICVSSFACVLCFVVMNFYPNFSIPGVGYIETGFGEYQRSNITLNSYARPNIYDEEEKAFVEKVKDVVDPDYSIYNNADDGSPFAYAFDDLNLLYRRSATDGESKQSKLLRDSIDELSTNSDVQDALQKANARYILILDQGGEVLPERCYYGYYAPSRWQGANAIDDDTPGLKVLLSEGDMRLYEIDYEALDSE